MPDSCLLYYITDRRSFAGDEPTRRRLLLAKIAEAVDEGIDYIQLREKDLSSRELESLAREAMQIISKKRTATDHRPPPTALLINSRADVAIAAKADGIHLRSNDISPEEVRTGWRGAGALAREISPRNPLIAISCHSPREIAEAAANAVTFAVFAPIFEKKDAAAIVPTGLDALHQACRAQIPVLALGGITLQNAKSCLEAGAAGIAAIRLFQQNNIATVISKLRR
jgi:thiamine-phosphate pyrophosphorylase